MLEPVSPTESSTPTSAGGAAPAHRQCRYTKADGHKCHDWAIRGQDYCGRHGRFVHARADRPIDVPLLEDEASIVLVLSDTVRALAWGTIPVSNGHKILNALRLAYSIQCRRLEMAKLRLKLRRLGIPENEIFDEPRTTIEPDLAPVPGAPSPDPELNSELGALSPDACSVESPDESFPRAIMQPSRHAQFRDLKKNWDKDLQRVENEMADMYGKRYGETKEDFLAARATPFENLAKEEPIQIAIP